MKRSNKKMITGKTAKRNRKWLLVPAVMVFLIIVLAVSGVVAHILRSGNKAYVNSDEVRVLEDAYDQGIGTVQISTLSVPEGICVKRACYSVSGQVILSYSMTENGTKVNGIAIMADDGTDFHSIYQGKGVGKRLLPFQDNCRILMGDSILECPEGTTLDTCPENAAFVCEIVFPDEYVNDKKVSKLWSEVIIAPDNEHMAWTMLRSDCGAAVAIGTLIRDDFDIQPAYRLENAQLCSRMNVYTEDPSQDGFLQRTSVIGGEVKQFVHGGQAISLVGANGWGDSESVLMDVSTGEYTMVTNTPGYDESTIFSPDEAYGLTMTTRFSETTRMDILGVLPRPCGDALQNMTSTIYMYGVTGVRQERAGNIGPALINIERSMSDSEYMGIDLSLEDDNWVYCSPMSWNDNGTKGMWMEEQREGGGVRVQVVTMLDKSPTKAIPTVTTPPVGDYADRDSQIEDVEGTIAGTVSGTMHITKKTGLFNVKTVEIRYKDYSDDGVHYYNGTEYSKGSVFTSSAYSADLKVTDQQGNEIGSMDVALHFGGAYTVLSPFTGSTTPHLDLDKSRGTALWQDKTWTAEHLVR